MSGGSEREHDDDSAAELFPNLQTAITLAKQGDQLISYGEQQKGIERYQAATRRLEMLLETESGPTRVARRLAERIETRTAQIQSPDDSVGSNVVGSGLIIPDEPPDTDDARAALRKATRLYEYDEVETARMHADFALDILSELPDTRPVTDLRNEVYSLRGTLTTTRTVPEGARATPRQASGDPTEVPTDRSHDPPTLSPADYSPTLRLATSSRPIVEINAELTAVAHELQEIEDPDWETFENIAPAVEGDHSLLRRLLPTSLWRWMFAPTDLPFETIARHRSLLVRAYDSVVLAVGASEVRLQQLCLLPVSADSLARLADHTDRPITADPISDRTLKSEQSLLTLVDRLLTPPAGGYLREDERERLTELQALLAHATLQRTTWSDSVAATHEDARETAREALPDWQDDLSRYEARAAPYLRLDEFLAGSTLLEDIGSLKNDVVALRESVPFDLETTVGDWIDELRQLERDVTDLHESLKRSRVRFATQESDTLLARLQTTIDAVDEAIQPARSDGESIESPERLRDRIADRLSAINSLRATEYSSHIPADRLARLDRYESKLEQRRQYIAEKASFDTTAASRLKYLRAIHDRATPYLDYDAYLPEPERNRLLTWLDRLDSALAQLESDTNFEILADTDRNRLERLRSNVKAITRHLTDYNPEFVERQRQNCAQWFEQVGSDGIDLTAQQERAIVRNGVYNQVIAAAGTGKTLTLTARVAYLVEIQGVDPKDILVVTFTNEATDEMESRLNEQFGITAVEVRTIHSFGRHIVQQRRDGYVRTIDTQDTRNLIDDHIREATASADSEFLSHYYEYLVHFDTPYEEEADFDDKRAYVQARADREYTTLKNETVKSRAEKTIADFLFTHQVDYQYERRAAWADTDPEKAGYSPDFYLPEYDIYIEHWGLNEAGAVAPWFSWSTEEYHDKLRWARRQFTEHSPQLLETYEFEHASGRLKRCLRHRLTNAGVSLDRMGFEDLVETAFEYDQIEDRIKRQFVSFIQNAKRFDVTLDDIKASISRDNPRQYHFAKCGIELLQEYILYLSRNDLIDFTDMIDEAVDLVEAAPSDYRQDYDQILVDEFQDVGKSSLELIDALTGPNGARLFAVGDDWQSIFSFQGAVVDYFVEFADLFGEPVRTDLTTNFRSPPTVVQAGNTLIDHNANQLDKEVTAAVTRDHTPRVHVLRDDSFHTYIEIVKQYTVNLVTRYLSDGAAPSEIMILCRYDGAVPYLDSIKTALRRHDIPYVGKSDAYQGPDGPTTEGVSVYSLYQAKGREAKHVIVVHVATGPYGLPPDQRDHDLLDPVQPQSLGGIAEERRAFYVALTRTAHTLDLVTRSGHESPFLDEIAGCTERVDAGQIEPLGEVGETMTIEATVDALREPWSKQHQRGTLSDPYGGSALFVSWRSEDPPTLDEGEWYRLEGVYVDEYKDTKEVVIPGDALVLHLSSGPSDVARDVV
jgi:DNA helicase-4